MLPLEPMGVGLRIEPEVGPIIDRPIRSAADVQRLDGRSIRPTSRSPSTRSAWSGASSTGRAGVIGFSGAPFTLACYLIEGRPSRDYALAKAFMFAEPAAWHELMERLSTMVIAYLQRPGRRRRRRRPAVRQLGRRARTERLRDVRPAPCPADLRRPGGRADDPFRDRDLGPTGAAGGRRRRRDRDRSSGVAGRRLAPDRLRPGGPGQPRRRPAAGRLGRDRGGRPAGPRRRPRGRPGHVFNLGHGVLPSTDTGLLRRLVEFVHEQTAQIDTSLEMAR